jgi:hypothetical protein
MDNPLLRSLSLLDTSGYVIIAIILVLLVAGVALTVWIRARYAGLERELRRHPGGDSRFDSPVLTRIVHETESALAQSPRDINTQAIIDRCFDHELRSLLIGERFIKASTGLLIILGLVGTFYGLTLSIGRLTALVTGDGAGSSDVTESLMLGLAQALSGMSVAFSCSLFGIVSAIVMTLVGVFANVGDRRNALMVEIEAYLDNELQPAAARPGVAMESGARAGGGVGLHPGQAQELQRIVAGFGQSVAQLQQSVAQFEHALQAFSTTTRDFREFNLHLKDNVQRMSLSFGDLSETLQQHARSFRPHE